MKTENSKITEDQINLMTNLKIVLGESVDIISYQEALGIVSQLVGQLIVLRDQKSLTEEEAMALATANIDRGRTLTINDLFPTIGNA